MRKQRKTGKQGIGAAAQSENAILLATGATMPSHPSYGALMHEHHYRYIFRIRV
ncbi:hypothetical protein PIB30_080552, partial [Stylosanthes scabra]|nr:hypothetical protein [Stylosanthes scabra]